VPGVTVVGMLTVRADGNVTFLTYPVA
jgi:hypothetical protein